MSMAPEDVEPPLELIRACLAVLEAAVRLQQARLGGLAVLDAHLICRLWPYIVMARVVREARTIDGVMVMALCSYGPM